MYLFNQGIFIYRIFWTDLVDPLEGTDGVQRLKKFTSSRYGHPIWAHMCPYGRIWAHMAPYGAHLAGRIINWLEGLLSNFE